MFVPNNQCWRQREIDKMKEKKLNWYQIARLKTIETVAHWYGQVNSSDIKNIFGISRIAALGDIQRYIELAPGNIEYNSTKKTFVASSNFNKILTSDSFDEYLNLDPSLHEHCEHVEKPLFNIPASIARQIMQAIKENKTISINYRSMSHPNGRKRSILPHTMVYSGFRWHVRAWCNLKGSFRDFNLSRIKNITLANNSESTQITINDDTLWNETTKVILIANPKLSPEERQLIESDFGMKNHQLILSIRAALLVYTLQIYQVDVKDEGNIYKQRLILDNKEELLSYLW